MLCEKNFWNIIACAALWRREQIPQKADAAKAGELKIRDETGCREKTDAYFLEAQ